MDDFKYMDYNTNMFLKLKDGYKEGKLTKKEKKDLILIAMDITIEHWTYLYKKKNHSLGMCLDKEEYFEWLSYVLSGKRPICYLFIDYNMDKEHRCSIQCPLKKHKEKTKDKENLGDTQEQLFSFDGWMCIYAHYRWWNSQDLYKRKIALARIIGILKRHRKKLKRITGNGK